MKANSQALALVVFLLLFLGIGYIGIGWLFPAMGLAATSFWALVFWGILLFLAVLATSVFARRPVIGAWIKPLFISATSLVSSTHQIRALGSKL